MIKEEINGSGGDHTDHASGKIGTNVGSGFDFTTELFLLLAADDGPLHAAGTPGAAGTDVDFFGKPRGAALPEAGPFQHVSGKTTRFQLWPPGHGGAVPVPKPPAPR